MWKLLVCSLVAAFALALGVASIPPPASASVADDAERAANDANDADDADDAEDLVEVELSTIGVDMRSRSPVVLLRDAESDQVVPIWVGLAEAQAIYRTLHDLRLPRPMTHDLLASVVGELGAEVEEVVVHALREGTYYGRLRLREADGGERRDLDTRPSDGMALALRVGAPIRVAREILEETPPFDFVIPDEMEPVVRTLGVTVVELTDERREADNIPADEVETGVVVTAAAGPAREQGLERGDVIVAVEDRAVDEPMAFFDRVREALRDERVRLTVWRDGETFEVELEATLPPPEPPREPEGMEI